jgi:hypothetical protein
VVESVHRAESIAATTANEVRTVLKVLSAEVTDCPRFFTLAAMTTTGWSRAAFWKYHYKLTLWCEDLDVGILFLRPLTSYHYGKQIV